MSGSFSGDVLSQLRTPASWCGPPRVSLEIVEDSWSLWDWGSVVSQPLMLEQKLEEMFHQPLGGPLALGVSGKWAAKGEGGSHCDLRHQGQGVDSALMAVPGVAVEGGHLTSSLDKVKGLPGPVVSAPCLGSGSRSLGRSRAGRLHPSAERGSTCCGSSLSISHLAFQCHQSEPGSVQHVFPLGCLPAQGLLDL